MVLVTRRSFWSRAVRFSVAAMLATLIGAGRVMPAAAQSPSPCIFATGSNTFFGTDAGTGVMATQDSAFGFAALASGDSGGANTAVGNQALCSNTTGGATLSGGSTAVGNEALFTNTSGGPNDAFGSGALLFNTTGSFNAAFGAGALQDNTTGEENVAFGEEALDAETTGFGNIAVGVGAGSNLTTGDNNIDIFDLGVAGESNTIRIGTQGFQSETFVAGIFGGATIKKGCDVVVDATGLLGCAKSSARYKRDIRDMGDASDKLMKLRPVTFTYKADSTGIQQYGLIAEEVEKVYPELVIDGADGKAETVAYQVLPALLLNEVQKLAKENQRLLEQVAALKKKDAQIDALAERINALERQARRARPEHLASAMR